MRGLRTKTHDFYCSLLQEDYDIIALTETWLVNEINNSEIFDKRYDVIRKDRDNKKKRGGGVLLALKKNIHFQVIYIYIMIKTF